MTLFERSTSFQTPFFTDHENWLMKYFNSINNKEDL